ncbi:MAG: adenylate/guanylate cyclase domain-containing protein [Armatimonadota bacterium]|nr:adenylate/guanylate cyclase domain-containing protein [Armatimonadota bacterium]
MSIDSPRTRVCPACGTVNPAEAQFCMRCGVALARRCLVCGTDNAPDAQFCLRCGAPLAVGAVAERRVVTVLFADLVGSTPLTLRQDPEATRALVAEYFAAMRGEIERYGGTVEKFVGDAVMAVFGLPVAHEDDPERAVRAAWAMFRRLATVNARQGADLQIRIGIATGEVVADSTAAASGSGQFMVTGEAVNLAARLQQGGVPGAIVVDDRTHDMTVATVRYEALPAPQDGDFPGVARYRVVEVLERRAPGRPAVKGLRAPLVGRQDEMEVLQVLYRRVVEDRKHHLVTVIGPAGVGKSRLAQELVERLQAAAAEATGLAAPAPHATAGADSEEVPRVVPPPQVLRGRCPAYGEGLTYWPLVEMLKQECGIKDNDPAEVAAQKLVAGVQRVVEPHAGTEETDRTAAELAALLGVRLPQHYEALWRERLAALKQVVEGRPSAVRQPQAETEGQRRAGDELARAWRTFLLAKAQQGPLLLLFEDLHWAEESLLDLLETLAVRGLDAPILTLCLARPEFLERHPGWGGRVRNYVAVSLSPLSTAYSRRLLGALLQGDDLPPDVREAVLARAEGNPYFIEEILRMLIDAGDLVREEVPGPAPGAPAAVRWRWAATHPVEIRLPDTIHGILASRLDLLSPLEKRVAQVASVVGRIFWLGGVAAAGAFSLREAAVALERLQERELVEELPTAHLAGEREFRFKHALVREVAHASLPKAARSEAHQRFATWLERVAVENLDEHLEVLAHHYEQAWRYRFETGDRSEAPARRAVEALRRAGQRAKALRTLPEARRLFERALAIVRSTGLDADQELLVKLLTDHAEVAKWMTDPATVLEDTDTVLRLAPPVGREDLVARAWLNRAFAMYDRSDLEGAEEAVNRALELFRALEDRQGEAEALEWFGNVVDDLRENPGRAQKAYRKAIELYRELGDGQGVARATAWLGRSLITSGAPLAQAKAVLTEALALGRTHRERLSEPSTLLSLGIVAHLTGDHEEAVRLYRAATRARQELGDPLYQAAAHRHLGMHYLRYGYLDEAQRELEETERLIRQHAGTESPMALRGLAEVALARGDVVQAADLAEKALALVQKDQIARATFSATLGKVRAAQGRGEEAEALFRGALETLEQEDFRIDLALTLLKYGEALLLVGEAERAVGPLLRARGIFQEMGATYFVREVDGRLQGAAPSPATPP